MLACTFFEFLACAMHDGVKRTTYSVADFVKSIFNPWHAYIKLMILQSLVYNSLSAYTQSFRLLY